MSVRDGGQATLGGGREGPPAHRLRQGDSWPRVPDEVTGDELDKEVRQQDLRTLSVENAEWVSRHLVMVARSLDEDPDLAWKHAQAAVSRAGRVPAVREAAGIAAYRAGEFAKALTELRAARRMSGNDQYLAIIADCERGLGRAEKALTIAGSSEAAKLPVAGRVEMRIVAAGARLDLGQPDAALVTLQCQELNRDDAEWAPRLKYAYADALLTAGRTDEATEWFGKAAAVDVDGQTDAEERWAELMGVTVEFIDGDDLDEVPVDTDSGEVPIDTDSGSDSGTDIALGLQGGEAVPVDTELSGTLTPGEVIDPPSTAAAELPDDV